MQGVASSDDGVLARVCLVVAVTLVHTTSLLARSRKTTRLAVLVDGVDDPADARVAADGVVRGVHADDFEVLVDTVLVDPVAVQYTKVGTLASDTLLSKGTQASGRLHVVNTLTDGLTVGSTLGDVLLAVTTANTDTVDDVSLLRLVS